MSHASPPIPEHADEWHRHAALEGMPQREHTASINVPLVLAWLVGILIFVVGLVVVLCIYFDSTATQLRAQRVETTVVSKVANSVKAEAQARLGVNGSLPSYSWSDMKTGTVQLPLEYGIRKVLDKYGTGSQPDQAAAAQPAVTQPEAAPSQAAQPKEPQ